MKLRGLRLCRRDDEVTNEHRADANSIAQAELELVWMTWMARRKASKTT